MSHRTADPAILYFGTPVVLVGARSKTPANILRTGECVLNLPSVQQVAAVDRLAAHRAVGVAS